VRKERVFLDIVRSLWRIGWREGSFESLVGGRGGGCGRGLGAVEYGSERRGAEKRKSQGEKNFHGGESIQEAKIGVGSECKREMKPVRWLYERARVNGFEKFVRGILRNVLGSYVAV